MSLINSILSVFKPKEIYFKEKYHEVGDVYTFIFEVDSQQSWKAGQHGIFTIVHKKINRPTRAFSIASIPSEGYIKITTRIGKEPSEFKQALLLLEPGMKVTMRGPVGAFYTPNNKPKLFIAGGIGITPYRAIFHDMLLNDEEAFNDSQLLYMDTKGEFIYNKELNKLVELNLLSIIYTKDRVIRNEKIKALIDKHQEDALFYIVGSKSMVKEVEKYLIKNGITKKNIKRDVFLGF